MNQELVLLYWGIGKEILTRQQVDGWGTRVIERLAKDLRTEFPGYMKAFAEAWPDESILQAPLAKSTWHHNLTLLEKVKSSEERLWFAVQAVKNGWNRNVLVIQIESGLYHRQRKATTNFQATLPAPQYDLAQQLIKNPYNFDFLTLTHAGLSAKLGRSSQFCNKLLQNCPGATTEDGPVQAGVRRQVELLPIRRR